MMMSLAWQTSLLKEVKTVLKTAAHKNARTTQANRLHMLVATHRLLVLVT